jgi:acyl carrier protein
MPVPQQARPATRLLEVLAAHSRSAGPEIRSEHRLIEDLGLDSVALAQVVVSLELAYDRDLPQERLHELRGATVADLQALVETGAST